MELPFPYIGVIDTMMHVPEPGSGDFKFLRGLLKGTHASESEGNALAYLFGEKPGAPEGLDSVDYVLGEMDKVGIEKSLIGLGPENSAAERALTKHPDRFASIATADPNQGMDAVRKLERDVRDRGAKAAFSMPAFVTPQVPINDKKFFPIYAKCIELDIPIFLTTGVPGPRVPMDPQRVELIDEVCWFFPELKLVMRHGAEPWEAMAVKLMIKWPNLYYSTSAFAPKHYPKAIIDFANTRGSEKIMYAGYFPIGLTLERIFRELPNVPFRDHVWPNFLRKNAQRVLNI